MTVALRARFASAAELTRHLDEHDARGATLLPLAKMADQVRQFDRISLELCLREERAELEGEVLQVLPLGLVLRLTEPALARVLLETADSADEPAGQAAAPIEVSLVEQLAFVVAQLAK